MRYIRGWMPNACEFQNLAGTTEHASWGVLVATVLVPSWLMGETPMQGWRPEHTSVTVVCTTVLKCTMLLQLQLWNSKSMQLLLLLSAC